MFCKSCGAKLQADSSFCMRCGAMVNTTNEKKETITGKILYKTGEKTIVDRDEKCNNRGRKPTAFLLIAFLFLCIIGLTGIGYTSLRLKYNRSPIEGVSKEIYDQGLQFLTEMDSETTQNIVAEFVETHDNIALDKISKNIPELDFTIKMHEEPSLEEVYYSDLINKFWELKVVCNAHKAILNGYDSYKNSEKLGEVTAYHVYKSIVSEQEDKIKRAETILRSATSMEEMKKAYQVLEEVWKDN